MHVAPLFDENIFEKKKTKIVTSNPMSFLKGQLQGINVRNMCLFLVPGIFIFAAIPFSIAGFGTREAGSLFFLVYLNLPFEQIVAGSIVFGLTATIQGLFFVVLNLVMFKKQG